MQYRVSSKTTEPRLAPFIQHWFSIHVISKSTCEFSHLQSRVSSVTILQLWKVWENKLAVLQCPRTEIDLDFPTISDFFTNELILWTITTMNCTHNYYASMQNCICCVKQINVLSICTENKTAWNSPMWATDKTFGEQKESLPPPAEDPGPRWPWERFSWRSPVSRPRWWARPAWSRPSQSWIWRPARTPEN